MHSEGSERSVHRALALIVGGVALPASFVLALVAGIAPKQDLKARRMRVVLMADL